MLHIYDCKYTDHLGYQSMYSEPRKFNWSKELIDPQNGFLVERRLHKRKWKWAVHGAPKEHQLSATTAVQQSELNEKIFSLFFATTKGYVFEYQLPKNPGSL